MEEGPISSIQVVRINAEPVDARPGGGWMRAALMHPWLDREHLHALQRMHPGMPTIEVTTVSGNMSAWASMSDYLEEMEGDPQACAISGAMVDGAVSLDAVASYEQAEMRDREREVTLFTWSRPLARMATHVAVRTASRSSPDGVAELSRLLGGCVVTRHDGEWTALLAAGSPGDVHGLVHQALAPELEVPPPWRPEWKCLIQNCS